MRGQWSKVLGKQQLGTPLRLPLSLSPSTSPSLCPDLIDVYRCICRYIGDLEDVFKASREYLEDGGLFGFTCELISPEDCASSTEAS